MPKVSIIIPAYNAEKTLEATLNSIRAQSYRNWEAFVIDDASTDSTAQIASTHAQQNKRIHLVTNTKKGPSNARNHGALNLATGEIIAFCDADDLWQPDKLKNVVDALKDDSIDAVFGRVAFFKRDPERMTSTSTLPGNPVTIQTLLGENPVCTMSNLSVRREVFARTGGFNPRIVHNEDLEWLVRLVGTGGCLVGLDQLHVLYRTSLNGLSANIKAMHQGRQSVLETARQFGVTPDLAAEAIYMRYLARRALRVNAGRAMALRMTLNGISMNPRAFLLPVRRGLPTAIGAGLSLLLPDFLNRALFQR